MPNQIRTYRDLVVWQKSMDVALAVMRLTDRLRGPRFFALVDQLLPAALSVPSNLAEGHGRRSRAEYTRYVSISNGSLRELETQLLLLGRFESAVALEVDQLLDQTDEVGRMLNGLHRRLQSGTKR
jgi:four helix bundle protein